MIPSRVRKSPRIGSGQSAEQSLEGLAPDPRRVFAAFHSDRQERCCSRKGLDSGFLLDAEPQGALGWSHIHPDDSGGFSCKVRGRWSICRFRCTLVARRQLSGPGGEGGILYKFRAALPAGAAKSCLP